MAATSKCFKERATSSACPRSLASPPTNTEQHHDHAMESRFSSRDEHRLRATAKRGRLHRPALLDPILNSKELACFDKPLQLANILRDRLHLNDDRSNPRHPCHNHSARFAKGRNAARPMRKAKLPCNSQKLGSNFDSCEGPTR